MHQVSQPSTPPGAIPFNLLILPNLTIPDPPKSLPPTLHWPIHSPLGCQSDRNCHIDSAHPHYNIYMLPTSRRQTPFLLHPWTPLLPFPPLLPIPPSTDVNQLIQQFQCYGNHLFITPTQFAYYWGLPTLWDVPLPPSATTTPPVPSKLLLSYSNYLPPIPSPSIHLPTRTRIP